LDDTWQVDDLTGSDPAELLAEFLQ